jgi:protein subunit release factor B
MTTFLLMISAGAGPAEARQFVALLANRMVSMAAQRRLVLTLRSDDGAPPRSVRLFFRGDPVAVSDLVGTHALVYAARGPNARKRWFASVTCHPAIPGGSVPLRREDVVLAATRAGGPGGQRVNKVASAVRAVHVPSGIAVRADGERSQTANRRVALARLSAELAERARAAEGAAAAARRAEHHRLQRGGAAWTYRLVDEALVPEEP